MNQLKIQFSVVEEKFNWFFFQWSLNNYISLQKGLNVDILIIYLPF
jgi:hypothetical protein